MAMPKKSEPAKYLEGKTGLKKTWWRNPAIIAAIITAIAVICAAFIQRPTPNPKLSEPMKIEQHTHGSDSPAVGQTGGNVTIQQQERREKP